MPWTFAHPAIVLPIIAVPAVRKVLRPVYVLAAMLGALSPDFGYYLGSLGPKLAAHSLLGSVLLCIPMVWLVILLLLASYRFLLLPLAPSHQQLWNHWLTDARQGCTAQNAVWISLCIWCGALSHIAWDHFTHRTGWAVLHWPAVFDARLGAQLAVYELLQHLSTLIGSVALFVSYRNALHRSAAAATAKQSWFFAHRYLIGAIVVAGIVGVAAGIHAGLEHLRYFWRVFYFEGAVAATQAFALVWLLLCLYLSTRKALS
jgi:hypothetical protein